MTAINLHNKKFTSLENAENGEVTSDTIFHYRQSDDHIWASYQGGKIAMGTLVGKIEGNKLRFLYQHMNQADEFLTGYCETKVLKENGKIQLHESWRWTCKDFSQGTSVLEEI